MILGEDFVLDLMAGDKKAVNKLEEISVSLEQNYICSTTILDLVYKISKALIPVEEKQAALAILSKQNILDFDDKSAIMAAKILVESVQRKEKVGEKLAILAGVGKRKHMAILTNQVKGISNIDGVDIVSY